MYLNEININYATHSMAMFAFYTRISRSRSFCPSLSVPPIGSRRLIVLSFLLHFSSEMVCQSLIYSRYAVEGTGKECQERGKKERERVKETQVDEEEETEREREREREREVKRQRVN